MNLEDSGVLHSSSFKERNIHKIPGAHFFGSPQYDRLDMVFQLPPSRIYTYVAMLVWGGCVPFLFQKSRWKIWKWLTSLPEKKQMTCYQLSRKSPIEWDQKTQIVREFFRDPQQWDPLVVSFPYHSHIFRDSYGSGMGIVQYGKLPIRGSHCWGSLESPLR